MKYVIHQKSYAYNDQYTEIEGRSVLRITEFDSEEEALKEWVRLEKEYGNDDDEEAFYLTVEPIVTNVVQVDKFYKIIKVLKDHDIEIGEFVEPTLKMNPVKSQMYGISEDLPINQLPDEVFLDLILELNINNFTVFKYNDLYNWVIYFNVKFDYDFDWEKGYLTYFSEQLDSDAILCETNQDKLFNHDIFRYEFNTARPLTTQYTEKDQQNPILQTLLKQYHTIYLIENDTISYAPLSIKYYDDDMVKRNIASLRAVNDLLAFPFFQIQTLSAERVIELNKKLSHAE